MEIQRENDVQVGENYVETAFRRAYLGMDFLLDLFIIFYIVDGISNAFYHYPSFVTVPMKQK